MNNIKNNQIGKSVSWGMIETLSTYIARFVIGIVLARLLTPSDFGLIGMITIFVSITDVFVNAGFGQAFIQKKNATQEDANTVFIINFILGLSVYIVLWFCAPFIAHFFNQPILLALVRVFFLIIIINSLNVIQQSIIRKELQFKRRALLTIISSIISGVVGIIWAYKGLGVWSLVIQQIVNKTLLCSLLYFSSPWRLTMNFSRESAKSMFSFGVWLMITNFISAIFNQFYRIFIAKEYSADQLGIYDRAHQFQSMIANTFTWVFAQVAFPVFSKVQDDESEIRVKMHNFIRFSSFIVFPLLAIMFVVSRPLIIFLLTDKWIATIPLLRCFCLVGLMVPLYTFLGPLLQGIGKSKLSLIFTIIVCFGRIINVIITFRYGLQFIIIGEFFVLLITVIFFSLWIKDKIRYNYLTSIFGAKWSIFSTIVITIIGLRLVDIPSTTFLQIIFPSIVMMVVYLAIIWQFDKKIFTSLKSAICKKNG